MKIISSRWGSSVLLIMASTIAFFPGSNLLMTVEAQPFFDDDWLDDVAFDEAYSFEEAILTELFEATNGPRWRIRTNWVDGRQNFCTWHGITCYDMDSRAMSGLIRIIRLENNKLSGTVPTSIYSLPYLETLILRDNPDMDVASFEGIANATELYEVRLSGNDLSSIDGIGDAPAIEWLHLTANALEGTIPEELFDMVTLRGLYLNFNGFTGPISPKIGQLERLEEFFVYDNDLSGPIPSEMGLLRGLTTAAMALNRFTGTLPTEFSRLTNLETMGLQRDPDDLGDGYGLTGPLPSLDGLEYLQELYLYNNHFTGTIPEGFLSGIVNRRDPVTVDLSFNELGGSIPMSLTRYPRLSLGLVGNRIDEMADELCFQPKWMGGDVGLYGCDGILCPPGTVTEDGRRSSAQSVCANCPAGTFAPFYGSVECSSEKAKVDISWTTILTELYGATDGKFWKEQEGWLSRSSSPCDWFGITCAVDEFGATALTQISLPNNELLGTLPSSIFSLPDLHHLDLGGNSIEISFDYIGLAADTLKYLYLPSCGLKDLRGLSNARSLEILDLSHNDLGPKSAVGEVTKLPMLRSLILSHNNFEGTLPPSFGDLSQLEELRCYGSGFKGQIPTTLGRLSQLKTLDLSENSFSGTLPVEFDFLNKLTLLSIHQVESSNGIGGKLPAYSNMARLTELYLDSNSLTGPLPPNLFSNSLVLDRPMVLGLSGNELSGDLPIEYARFTQLNVDLTDNRIGGIPELLCRKRQWMDGWVNDYGCDAILCPTETYNTFGRRSSEGLPCKSCAEVGDGISPYLGATQCLFDKGNSGEGKSMQAQQRDILEKLYFTTGGRNWNDDTNWMNEAVSTCEWGGITCAPGTDHVIAVNLTSNGLSGTLPQEIYNLPYLRELYLQGNAIRIRFDQVGKATRLRTLSLSETGLDSLDGIGAALSLEVLHATDNNLSGSIPKDVLDLSNLKELYLNYNLLKGKIPNDINRLKNLEELFLYHNHLSGQIPASLGALGKLRILTIAVNDLTGTLPEEMSQLTQMEILSLEGNNKRNGRGIGGPLLDFAGMTRLKELYLNSNDLTGPIPPNFLAGITVKDNPIKVDLIENRLEGSLPSQLANFERLKLYVAGNHISSIPDILCQKRQWLQGDVGKNGCEGILCPPGTFNMYGRHNFDTQCDECTGALSAPYYGSLACTSDLSLQQREEASVLEGIFLAMGGPYWKNNANWMDRSVSICSWYGITCLSSDEETVRAISLPNNGLYGTMPSDVYMLPNLQKLDLSHNDDIVFKTDGIEKASNLSYLNLDDTGLTTLEGIEKAASLSILHVVGNDLTTDNIPESLLTLENLEVLYLSNNAFSGQLPAGLRNAKNLRYFSCFECGLEGPIPNWLGSLKNMEYLRLDGNSFSGTLPTSLLQLTQIQHLDLSQQTTVGGKGLTGPLLAFDNNPDLHELLLYSNSLTGTIPSNFLGGVDKTRPMVVDLRGNSIKGKIPSSMAGIERLMILLADNQIDTLPEELCLLPRWMKGVTPSFGCDAILCPPNTYNSLGRQTDPDFPCVQCPGNFYFGSTSCNVGAYMGDDETEKDILKLLYRETRGDSWVNKDNWLDVTVTMCEWYGIRCSGETGKVVSIQLTGNGLTGKLPPEIFMLESLTALVLKENHIEVNFESIGKATSLKVLVLSNMGLKNIDGIGNAVGLTELHLTDNELSGPFPREIFGLTSLRTLYANYNKFSGNLQGGIGRLINLTELYLFHNQLSGQLPSQLGNLLNLEVITLAENRFTGTIPMELNRLLKLRVLAIQREGLDEQGGDMAESDNVHAGLTGPLPPFARLKNLEELYLGSNSLTGTIPSNFLDGIVDKTKPIKVDVTLNRLTGVIPPELSSFPKLKLYAAGNQMSGIGEGLCYKNDWMGGMVRNYGCDAILCPPNTYNEYGRQPNDELECLPCDGAESVAAFWGSLTCDSGSSLSSSSGEKGITTEKDILTHFYEKTGGSDWEDNSNWGDSTVDICLWYGIVCSSEGSGTVAVSKIYLDSNNMAGMVPSEIFQLPYLSTLELSGNPNLDIKLDGISNAGALTTLNIDATKVRSLNGIGGASNGLVYLSAQNNNIVGKFPPEIFNLKRLKYLNIANNRFTGELPNEIGTLKILEQFHCAGNNFRGQIPSEIGELSLLKVLAMSENNFSGTLPVELGELRNLRGLFLDSFTKIDNGISGPLLSFSNSPDLEELYMGGNSLTGTIPFNFLEGVAEPNHHISIMLRSNQFVGTLPATLARLQQLDIDVAGNKIEGIHPDLCKRRDWMGGKVADYQCDAILCPPGYFNAHGRQATDMDMCERCEGSSALPYFGSMECKSKKKVREREILELFYRRCSGDVWKNKEKWLDPNEDYCDWYGISCHEGLYIDSILLGSNNVKGTPPKEIFELEHLKWLWMYSNPVDFSFEGVENAKRLSSLLLDSTFISSLSGVGKATALTELDLRFNKLSGPIPDEELKDLMVLESLSLSENKFTGPIPTHLELMTTLKKLRLGGNLLTGSLPDFAMHAELKSIDLSSNLLTGTIPSTMLQSVDPSHEVFLDLSSNMLTGSVPTTFGRFDKLTIYMRGNRISELDPSLCTKELWMDGDVGDFDCDGLLCKPGTWSETGRETKSGGSCKPCDISMYYGSTKCGYAKATSSARNKMMGLRPIYAVLIVGLGLQFA